MRERTIVTRSEEATEALAEALGQRLSAGTVLTLDGDLGAGKTTFVRGLARGLGIEDGISSPTYTLLQTHEGGRIPLYHFDAWLEGREKALLADGADEWLGGDGVAVVEWAGRVAEWLPTPRIAVRIEHRSELERTVVLAIEGSEEGSVDSRQRGRAFETLLRDLPRPEGAHEALDGESA